MADLKATYQEAFDAFLHNDHEKAIEGYQRAIAIDSSFALAYQGLAEVYSRSGNLDSAIATIKKAIELDPDESLFHTSLSRFYQMQGRIPEAEQEGMIATQLQNRGKL